MSPAELADNGDRYHIDEFFNRFGGWAWARWPEIAAALRQADTDRAELERWVHAAHAELRRRGELEAELAALRAAADDYCDALADIDKLETELEEAHVTIRAHVARRGQP